MASNRAKNQIREEYDFYATPSIATEALLALCGKHGIMLPKRISEPMAGLGHISEVLEKHGYQTIRSDLIARLPNIAEKDFFLMETLDGEAIVTNPPYGRSEESVEKAMSLLKDGQYCIMFLKVQFIEGLGRYEKFYSKGFNPEFVFAAHRRVQCAVRGNFIEDHKLYDGMAEFASRRGEILIEDSCCEHVGRTRPILLVRMEKRLRRGYEA